MIPILYENNEPDFVSNGIGRLSDAIRTEVTEERNGEYYLEMDYPVFGVHFADIIAGRIIGATHDDNGDIQPFQIYRVTEPINFVVTVYAWHISYQQNAITSAPFTATGCAAALAGLKANSYNTNNFTYWTDISSTAEFSLTRPEAIRPALGGIEGSVLDIFGGEYEFDKLDVKLHAARGSVKDVAIRYAKNLVDFENDVDYSEVYNAVIPFWAGTGESSDEIVVTGTLVNSGEPVFDGSTRCIPMDLSDQFESVPTAAELNTLAASILDDTEPWIPAQNIRVDFVQLWALPEYAEYAALQKIGLCDTVTVVFPAYGVSAAFKAVKTVYDTLSDRFIEMELGKLSTTLAEAITAQTQKEIQAVVAEAREIRQIASNTNQYFWFTETGTDTGAHITEIPRDEFLLDPTQGGGNLLARSNGVAVRDGLDELARFEAAGAQIGLDNQQHTEVTSSGFYIVGADASYMAQIVSTTATTSTVTLGSSSGNADALIFNGETADSLVLPSTPKAGTAISLFYGPLKDLGGTAADLTQLDITAGTAASGTDGTVSYTYDGAATLALTGQSGDSVWYLTYTLGSIYLPRLYVGDGIRMGQQISNGLPNNFVRVDDGNVRIYNTERFRALSGRPYTMGKPSYLNSLIVNGRDMFGGGKILWQSSAGWYVLDNQIVSLNEPISSQPNGIVMAWSNYNPGSGATNSGWIFDFLPKYTVDLSTASLKQWDGEGVFVESPQNLVSNSVKRKYIYVNDEFITGHANNSASGTGYANNQLVLRYIIGI